MFDVLDQLIGPLSAHISSLLSQPISGTDDQRAHADTKKAYLALLNNIMASQLQGIFISERRYMIFLRLTSLIWLWFHRKLCRVWAINRNNAAVGWGRSGSWESEGRSRFPEQMCCVLGSAGLASKSKFTWIWAFHLRTFSPNCIPRTIIAKLQPQGWSSDSRKLYPLAWVASFESYRLVRFYTKSLTFYKLSVGQGGQKPTISSWMSSFHPKIGPQRRR